MPVALWIAQLLLAAVFIYLDGQVARLALNLNGDVAPEEWELVKKLWSHPKRPAKGWATWIVGRLAARGYQRNEWAFYRMVGIVRGS